MPNINTIAYQSASPNQNGIAPNTNAQGTTETPVSLLSNPLSAALGIALGGGVIPLSLPGTSGPVQGSITAAGLWNLAKPWKIIASGTITTGTTCNVTVKLYQVPASVLAAGSQATLSNDNSMGSSGTFAVNTASANFYLEATMEWDSTSKKLAGGIKFYVNGALVAEAALTQITTATASDGELNFILSTTFSATNAANILQVQNFEIQQA
ncbi:MAG TPA: hypothetical protein VHA06_17925 [Candidatus Angelobacter sp.]|jgi:hypothetical protein|nr:hypothetical protein [Candidatus Angelobacter sp.]